MKVRREGKQRFFSAPEWIVLVLVVLGAVGAGYGLATQRIAI